METLARYIHQTPHRFVFIGAGSGTLALHSLSSVVGPNLLEATFPFSERAFESTLNENTKDAKDKTLQLAGKAFLRAIRICNDQEPLFGISFASKLKGLKECEAFLASWVFQKKKKNFIKKKSLLKKYDRGSKEISSSISSIKKKLKKNKRKSFFVHFF